MPRLTDFEALSFDCYGTLIDWETGLGRALRPLLAGTLALEEVLPRFGRLELATERAHPALPYPALLARVHRALAQELGRPSTPEQDAAFGASVGDWPAFPDSGEALRFLQSRYKLIVLSNVDRASFARSEARLGVTFDAVYTAEDVGSYKPDPANFRFLLERAQADLGVEPSALLHVAQSLFHDHVPARAAGLANCWIDRRRQSAGGSSGATAAVDAMPAIDFIFFSMAELAEAVRAAG